MTFKSSRTFTLIILIFVLITSMFNTPENGSALPITNSYDFSSGAGIDKWTWEKGAKHSNPTDTGSGSADPTDYVNISTENGHWITNIASNDGEYNSQMYKFNIEELPTIINDINISWKGHGEDNTGYDTTVDVWNYKSNQWEELDTKDSMGTNGWLRGSIINTLSGDPQNYISSGKLTVRTVAMHYEPPPCPYIYGWDGSNYKLIDSAITNSFFKTYQGTSYDSTPYLKPLNGYYDIMIHMSAPHTGHIDELDLFVIDHPKDTEIIADWQGNIHTIQEPQSIIAFDKNGKNLTSIINEKGGGYYSSDLKTKDFATVDDLYEWITIILPEESQQNTAKLIVDARWTPLGDLKIWYATHYMLGTPNLDYVLETAVNDPDVAQYIDSEIMRSSAFIIQFWNGTTWADYTHVPHIGMFFDRPQIIPIELNEIKTNQVRLYMPVGCYEIDYIAIDYTENKDVIINEVEIVEATKFQNDAMNVEVLNELSHNDDSYVIIEQEDYTNCKYVAIADPQINLTRSFVLKTTGYYYLNGPEVPENKIYNLPMVLSLISQPHAYSQWILPRYMDPENYPYSKYYDLSLVRPPFTVDWDALETDYVKVEINSDPPTVGGTIAKTNKFEVMTPYFLFSLIALLSIFLLKKRA